MHVLVVPSWYPTESDPVMGIFFKEQAEALQKYGHQVTVLFQEIWSIKTIGQHSQGLSVQSENGVPTYRFGGYNYLPRVPHSAHKIFYKRLKKLFHRIVKEQGKPDVLHAHCCLWGGWGAARLAEEEHIPLVVTEHSTAFARNLIKPEQKKYVRATLESAGKIIAVGPGLKKELSCYVSESEISVIPNIVNVDYFQPKIDHQNNKFRFFSVALLTHKKGVDLLLKAFANSFMDKRAELIIGGDGEEKSNLVQLAGELGIENQVHFLGKLTRNEVKEQMQQCNAFVLASRYETFGVVYIEALACGKPIVATACGGPEMIVNEQNGMLVPTENVDALSEAMDSIAHSLEKYDPQIIRQDCIDRFSEKSVVKEINKLYRELIENIK